MFDEWGRELRLKPQPDADSTERVYTLCSYKDLRSRFQYLPPLVMKTAASRKKQTTEQKRQASRFFLPYKEKRKLEVREQLQKQTKSKSLAQKRKESLSSQEFSRAFLDTAPVDESDSDADIPPAVIFKRWKTVAEECNGEVEETTPPDEFRTWLNIQGPPTDETSSSDSEFEFN